MPLLTPMSATPSTLADWADQLHPRGLAVLPQSHAVPVDLWVRDRAGAVLHLRARGTRVTLRCFEGSDLTTVLLRAECDCEEHRIAGAAGRVVLTPGVQPMAEVVYDGAVRAGWTGVEAGLLTVPEAAVLFDRLLDALPAGALGDVPRGAPREATREAPGGAPGNAPAGLLATG